MRSLLQIVGLLLLISCHQKTPNFNKESNLNIEPIETYSLKEVKSNNPVKEQKYKWVQYKRVPVIDSNDTIPVKNCYLLIESNVVSLYVEDKLIEKHNLIRDNQYTFPSYYFEDKPDDVLQYLDKGQNKIVIKRDNFDGVQEYYIKKNL
ncbi:MAG: hypothetical protein H6567_08230 [Lewinellaceae bacterium]|nr:hypothetical protein [Lewinellaceae bacterium]